MKILMCVLVLGGVMWGDTILMKEPPRRMDVKSASMDVKLIENAPWWDREYVGGGSPAAQKAPSVAFNPPLLENAPWWEKNEWQGWSEKPQAKAVMPVKQESKKAPIRQVSPVESAASKPEVIAVEETEAKPETTAANTQSKKPVKREWKESQH